MESFGDVVKKMRIERQLPLRTVAAFLDIDQAILSKIERGQRMATRKQVVKLAEYFNINESELMVSWLSDKLVYEVKDEDVALKALQVAEEKVEYRVKRKEEKSLIINLIKAVLAKDKRVSKAWLFGSMARGDNHSNSDIDLMVELNKDKKYSMFDLLDIAHIIEQMVNRKVDLVEKGYLKEFAQKSIGNELIKIYG